MKKLFLIASVFVLIVLAGCKTNEPDLQATAQFENALATALSETIAAVIDPTNAAATNISATQVEPSQVLPTLTELPTVNPLPTMPTATVLIQPTPTLGTPAATVQQPCYKAELVDETIPDGTKFEPGKWFVKTWWIKNAGVCEWDKSFRWVLVEGKDMNGPTSIRFSAVDIAPGEIVSIQFELKAPLLPGTYVTRYHIQTKDGVSITPNGFWLAIIVEEPEE